MTFDAVHVARVVHVDVAESRVACVSMRTVVDDSCPGSLEAGVWTQTKHWLHTHDTLLARMLSIQ